MRVAWEFERERGSRRQFALFSGGCGDMEIGECTAAAAYEAGPRGHPGCDHQEPFHNSTIMVLIYFNTFGIIE
jgi:hypothetical protein